MIIFGYEIIVKKVKNLPESILDEADKNGWPHEKLYLIKAYRRLNPQVGLYEAKTFIEDLFLYCEKDSYLMKPKGRL